MIPKFKVWDGEILHDVIELSWNMVGVKWRSINKDGYVFINQDVISAVKGGLTDLFIPSQIDNLLTYVGLFDKNGIDIYTDYIVMGRDSDKNVWIGPIVYHEGCYSFKSNYGSLLSDHYASQLEVIGNRYEHPFILDKYPYITLPAEKADNMLKLVYNSIRGGIKK